MQLKDFTYHLPQELIAQHPLAERSASRLMIIDRKTGAWAHGHFPDFLERLNPNDCLVMNDTKVIPARLYGVKENGGGKIEFLLLKKLPDGLWEVILKPGKRCREGAVVSFGDGLLKAEIISVSEGGTRHVRFIHEGIFEEVLDRLGEIPLPHYITEKLEDRSRYQTVYAKVEGSAAAPTAGLHFTEELLQKVREKGVQTACVTLHVGLGTFRPVKVENIHEHKMHEEMYSMPAETAEILNRTKEKGGRIIAVGTTACRVLETVAQKGLPFREQHGETGIFIYPGVEFRAIDGLITNFHLPESTLLMLVSAFAGRENMIHAYEEAVRQKYRFFSFGDAMMII